MAEARQAVAFSIKLSDDGIDWSLNFKALKEIGKSGIKSWKKGLYRIQNRFYNGLYPSRPGNWLGIVCGVFASSMIGFDLSFGLIQKIEIQLHRILEIESPRDHLVASLMYSCGLWTAGVIIRKYTLSNLLYYMDWMYEAQSGISVKTKAWMVLVTVLGGGSPKLYSYQGSLPKLPVPKLTDTINRFLKSMEPLLSEEEYSELRTLALEFRKKHGFKIQLYLYLKYLWSSNYISDWWEEFIYLASRSSLMINSNYYGMDAILLRHEWVQAARAANLVCASVQFMKELNNEEFEPLVLQGKVPLCSRQYERMFCTVRIPRFVGNKYRADQLVHYYESKYIVVICRGNYYKVNFTRGDQYLDPVDLEKQFQDILDTSVQPSDGSQYIGALTATERNQWGINRADFFKEGCNKESLDIIEKAAFMLVLEDEVRDYDPNDETKLDAFGRSLLHGKGHDRWYDKSFNMIVFKNGRVGFNGEHSWADAPVMAHYWEYILLEDILSPKYGYTPDGHCRGIVRSNLPTPQKLKWNITNPLKIEIEKSVDITTKFIEDLDLHIVPFTEFGRGFMKKCKVSPDGYIQMALQLAYYRDNKSFCLTYEASMTRLFREGRTETVRSCSNTSCDFIRSMDNTDISNEEKIRLFRIACDYHQKLYRDAMTGKGVDRHIFCMYVMSKYLKIESEFLTKALSVPWKLSTSQTPHTQLSKVDMRRYPNFLSAGGGFGPVASDGYGVSYMMAGENNIFFHISSNTSCPKTDSKRFAKILCDALWDIRKLFKLLDASGDK